MSRVLIIEDDELIAELERDYLKASGFEVEIALNGAEGLKRALSEPYDSLLLDLMLPGKNGFDICREIRKQSNVPVLMVTAKKEDLDKIRGLGVGADDYLVKPFSPVELVARVRSHIQIHERLLDQKKEEDAHVLVFENLSIHPQERRVYLNEDEIFLSNKEFEMLLFLAENPNIVFSKERLFDKIWGFDAVGSMATVTVHINRLREKLNDNHAIHPFIETVWGVGYRFRKQESIGGFVK